MPNVCCKDVESFSQCIMLIVMRFTPSWFIGYACWIYFVLLSAIVICVRKVIVCGFHCKSIIEVTVTILVTFFYENFIALEIFYKFDIYSMCLNLWLIYKFSYKISSNSAFLNFQMLFFFLLEKKCQFLKTIWGKILFGTN